MEEPGVIESINTIMNWMLFWGIFLMIIMMIWAHFNEQKYK